MCCETEKNANEVREEKKKVRKSFASSDIYRTVHFNEIDRLILIEKQIQVVKKKRVNRSQIQEEIQPNQKLKHQMKIVILHLRFV